MEVPMKEKRISDFQIGWKGFFHRWGVPVLVNLALVAVAVAIALGSTGYLNRFIYLPLPMEWINVPAGEFLMGSTDADAYASNDEKPKHIVYLDAYRIGKYEVTNAQYTQCVKARVCFPPYASRYLNEIYNHHPVVYVNWEDANAYCSWIGGRLPTEAEWEKAARGGLEDQKYSWGDSEPTCEIQANNGANYKGSGCQEDTIPVGSFAPNGYGLYDMAGNVWEWVSDWYDENYYKDSTNKNPKGPEIGDGHSVRGGSWLSDFKYLLIANRELVSPLGKVVYIVGFRCAISS